jgi:hypothetical protein
MKNILMVVIAILVAAVMSACSLFKPQAPQDELVLQLAVQSAAAEVFQKHPNWKMPAQEIMDVAIKAIDAKTVLDLGSTAAYVKSKIPMEKLFPPEQALVSVLVDTIVANIKADLAKRNVRNPAEQLVEVRKVLVWISDMAKIQVSGK